jgi:hypothetical protein
MLMSDFFVMKYYFYLEILSQDRIYIQKVNKQKNKIKSKNLHLID